jgi:AraC family transcriptional regulator
MKYNYQVLHGNIIKNTIIAGFALTETAYEPGLQIPAHRHDFAYFCFVLQGGFNEGYEKRNRSCYPFSLIFHQPQEAHSNNFYAATRCFNLQLSDSFLELTTRYFASAETPTDFGGVVSSRIAAKIYKEFRCTDELSSLIVEGLMFELLGEAVRRSKNSHQAKPPAWLIRTLELLQDRFQESLSLSEIAAVVGVHETHLARVFKRYYRSTVGEYLRHLRIEFACRELAASNTPLSEIALSTGFTDQSHFTKTFSQIVGMSPATYRRFCRGAKRIPKR